MQARTRRRWLGEVGVDLALLLAGHLFLYRTFLRSDVTLPALGFTDLRLLSQPSCLFSAQSLRDGLFPFWNPYLFAGFPHFAMPESALLYPGNALCGIVDFATWATADVLAHLFLMAASGYLLGREVFGSRPAALALGFLLLAGATSTGLIASGHLWAVHAAAWFPLALLLLRRLCRAGRPMPALALAAVLGIQALAGAPQLVAYQLLVCSAYAAFELSRARLSGASWRNLGARTALALLAVALGLALAAVQLVPSRELLLHSARGPGVSASYFFGGFQLTSAFLLDELLLRGKTLAFVPGALTLALALLGLLRGRDGERFAFLVVAGVAAGYVLLPTWAYDHLVRHLPGLGSTRFNTRISWFLAFACYVLAAGGVAVLAQDRRRWHWWLAAGLTVALSLAPWLEQPVRHPALAAVATGAAGAALAVWRWPGAARLALVGLGALLVVEGSLFWRGHARAGAPQQLDVDPGFLEFSRSRSDRDRIALFRSKPLRSRIHQNLGAVTGDRVLGGYHGLMLADYADFFAEVAGVPLLRRDDRGLLVWRTNVQGKDWITEQSLRAVDLLNVRWLVSQGLELGVPEALAVGEDGKPAAEGRRGFRRREVGALLVYENLDALPLAWLVHRVETVASDREARRRLADPAFDPRRAALLTTGRQGLRGLRSTGGTPEPVAVVEYLPGRVVLDVSASAPGILVLSDVHYPGWQVAVDDSWQDPLRVDALLLGAFVDAGRHRVRFEYRPQTLALGASVSGTAALLWCTGLALVLRRRRQSPPA